MFKLQVKERNKKDKCTCLIQLCAYVYAYSLISLCCMVTIVMVGNYIFTALIPVLEDAK